MEKKEKVAKASKKNHRIDRIFTKSESDAFEEKDKKEKEEKHLLTYGVKTFEDTTEIEKELPPLEIITEELNSEDEKVEKKKSIEIESKINKELTENNPQIVKQEIEFNENKNKEIEKIIEEKIDLEKLKEKIKQQDLGISEADIDKVQHAREQREKAKMEREIEKEKMRLLAETAKKEFEEKQKNKNKFKPKKKN